jgi:hypothetical protein
MRSLIVGLSALLVTAPLAVSAQVSAAAIGNGARAGARATVRANASFRMPEMFRVKKLAPAVVAVRAEGHTEYVLPYSVATNMRWELGADVLPEGVTMRSQTGEWRSVADHGLVLGTGAPTNDAEVVIRVRVSDGAPIAWQDALQLRVRGANGASMPVVVAE